MKHKTLRILDQQIKRYRSPLRIFSLIAMIFMFVCSLALFLTNKRGTSDYALENFTIYVVAMIFLFILFVFCYSGDYGDSLSSRYFEFLVIILYFSTFLAAVTLSFEGYPSYREMLIVLNVAIYFFSTLFCMVFWAYQYTMYRPRKHEGLLTGIFMSLCLADMTVSLLNPVLKAQYVITQMGYAEYVYNDMVSSLFLFAMGIVFTVYTVSIDCSLKKMLSMLSYFMLPVILIVANFIAYVFEPDFSMPAMSSVASVVALYLVFFNIHADQKTELIRQRAEYTEMRSALMLSQIQPHFIYNCLATISALCDFDPQLAKDTTNKFSDYLRANIDAMSANALIPFEKELKHVEAYTELEKTRFGDKLTVEYDIKTKDFSVPSLTLQPIVENAVKHGVCRKRGGGKVRITTFETADDYRIIVEDTGVGFDSDKQYDNEEGKHVGITNVKSRLQTLVDGTLTVESTYGEGTKATIIIPKMYNFENGGRLNEGTLHR